MKKNRLLSSVLFSVIAASIIVTGCGSSNYADTASTSEVMKSVGTTNDSYAYAEEAASYEEYSDDGSSYTDESGGTSDYDEATTSDAYNSAEKKIVYTYNVTVQTQDFDTLRNALYERVTEYNGYIESSYLDTYDNRTLSMTVRLPQDKAKAFLNYIGESGNVVSQSESATDRTLEYVDIDARLKSYNQELETLNELSKRAETVTELLEIENTIAEVRGNRDSLQSQLNSIDDKVNYTTIYVDLKEVVDYTYVKPTFFEKIASGWGDSMSQVAEMISDFIVAIPVFVVGLILFAIPAAVVLFVAIKVIRLVKRLAGKKEKKTENKTDEKKDSEANPES